MENRRTFRKAIAILMAMVFCGLLGSAFSEAATDTASPKYTFTLLRIQVNESGEPVTGEDGNPVTEVVLEGDLSGYAAQSKEAPIPIEEDGRYQVKVACVTEGVQIDKYVFYMNATEIGSVDNFQFVFAKGDKCKFSVEPYRANKGGTPDTQISIFFGNASVFPQETPTPEPVETPTPEPVETPTPEPAPQPVRPVITEAAINPGTFYLSAGQNVQLRVVTDIPNCRVQVYCGETPVTDDRMPVADENGSNVCTFDLTEYVKANAGGNAEMSFRLMVFYPKDPAANLAENPEAECESFVPEQEFKVAVVEKVQFLEGTSGEVNSDNPVIQVVVNKTNGTIKVQDTEYSAAVDGEGKASITIPANEWKKNTIFTLVYENDNGEKETQEVTYTYHQWAEIGLTEPTDALHLYGGDGNKDVKVGFAAAGEDGKAIQASLVYNGGTWLAEAKENNQFAATYGQLEQTSKIEFVYPEKTDDPSLKKSVEIKNEGEPDTGTLVIFWHTLEIEPVDNDSSEIVVRGAIPGAEVQLITGGDKETERTQKAADDGTVSFNTVKLKPETKIEAISTDSYGGTISVTAAVVKAPEFKRIAVESVSGVTEEGETDLPQDENGLYYINRDIVITGTGHAEQALTVQLTGSAAGEGEAAPTVQDIEKATDAAGAWSVPVSIEKLEDGDYQLLIRYPDYEESMVTVPFRVDKKVDVPAYFERDGQKYINVDEGAHFIEIEAGEKIKKATVKYYDINNKEMDISDDGMKAEFRFDNEKTAFTLDDNNNPDKAQIAVTDYTGNEEIYIINVVPQRLKVTMNDAEIGESGTSVFLTDSNSLVFRTEGTSDSAVKVMAIFDGTEPRLLKELAKGEVFVLNADTFEGQLKENERFGVQLIQADGAESWVTVTYDPACALELNTAKDDRGEFLQLEKTVTEISGTTDAGTAVSLTIRHKDAGAGETNIQAIADSEGKFTFSGLALQSGDTLTVQASDAAGNTAEKTLNVKSGGMKSPAGIFLLVAGMILMGFSIWFFLNTQKKIRQMEEISAANAATVREKNKEKR